SAAKAAPAIPALKNFSKASAACPLLRRQNFRRKKKRWLWTTDNSEATQGWERRRDLMEGHFAQDAGQMPTKLVVAPMTAQMQHHAVKSGQLFCQIIFATDRFHFPFLSF